MTAQTLPNGRTTTNAVLSRESDDWRLRGACRGIDPELFFSKNPIDREEAKRVCASCPVRAQCLDLAVEFAEPDGVWGGEERSERKRRRGASYLPAVQNILLTRRAEVDAAVREGLSPEVMAARFGTSVQTVNNLLDALAEGELDWYLDAPDGRTVQAYLAGEVHDVHPRDRLAAVVQGVRSGLTYAHFDRLHGLCAQSTEEFIRRSRRLFAAAEVEFPDMGRAIVRRALTNEQARQIRELSAEGAMNKELAAQFKISPKTVGFVLSGKRYKDAGGPLRVPGGVVQPVDSFDEERLPVVQQDMGAAA